MVARNQEVRCPTCGKLLAKRKAAHLGFEVRISNKLTINLKSGDITCEKCKTVTKLELAKPPEVIVPQNVPFV